MGNEKAPERVWLTVFTDDREPHFTMLEWQSPLVRNTQPGDYVATRPHHKVEYVPADLLATVRAEEKDAALSIVRACSTRDELYPDISITVSEFKERVIGLLKAENRKGEG